MANTSRRVTPIRTEYVQSQEMMKKRIIKRRRGLIRRLIAFAVVSSAVVFFMVSSLISQAHTLNAAQAEKSKLEKNIAESSEQTKRLKQRIQLLNDKDYIGEIARRDYLLSGEHETIFSTSGQDEH